MTEEEMNRKAVDQWAKKEKLRKAKNQEKNVEKKLRLGVKKLGGLCLKFVSPGTSGVFDRLILFPHKISWFIELKGTGKKLDPLQEAFKKQVEALGHSAGLIDTYEKVDQFLFEMTYEQNRLNEI